MVVEVGSEVFVTSIKDYDILTIEDDTFRFQWGCVIRKITASSPDKLGNVDYEVKYYARIGEASAEKDSNVQRT